MRIAKFIVRDQVSWGLVDGPEMVVFRGHPIFQGYETTGERIPLKDVQLLPPVLPTSKIICIGKNYADHAAEMGGELPPEPLIFLKPLTTVIGPDEQIVLPKISERVDHEGELAIVIGQVAKDVTEDKALDYVWGFTIANDVTARDIQKKDVQWTRAKSFDTFCPLGPWVETEFVVDGQILETRVDGEVRQHASIDLLIHKVPRIIQHVSEAMTLLPGDVILTGTPAGIGQIESGQTVEVTIEGIGTLTNPVAQTCQVMSNLITAPFSTATGSDVRVRFCPSPTGTPHVGLVRTALFNWAYARHTGGTFVFRIEDTDAERDSEESFEMILDGLRWLGLNWDEGIGVGGPHEPYRQSERTDIYLDVIEKLKASGHIYESFLTGEEIDERNKANGRAVQLGYDNSERELSAQQNAAYKAEGRTPALRLRVPDVDITFNDLVRGEITFPAGSFPDFVVVRPNGQPLYTLVNPVDDALMGVTHVLRGEDLLSSTPRQIALYNAMYEAGITKFIPQFGHLPFVMGEGNKKLSKRDPESNLFHHRDRGFIPEGLLNYLALLGWSISADRDVFSLDEMVQAFDVKNVNPNPARFDQKKADSINASHLRLLSLEDFTKRIIPYLQSAGVIGATVTDNEFAILTEAAPLIQERIVVLSEAVPMLSFLFVKADQIVVEEDAKTGLPENSKEITEAAIAALENLDVFETAKIQEVLNQKLIEDMAQKPRNAFGPLRTAISGKRISPPLFESMQILGKAETLARLSLFARSLQSQVEWGVEPKAR